MGSLGPHDGFQLRVFGAYITQAFGHTPYHVGSSLTKKARYRDVDVRLILPDDEYAAYFGPWDQPPEPGMGGPRLHMLELAWTTLGKKLTGLPIDFQIQPQTLANQESGLRSALLITEDDLPVVRTKEESRG